jgi:protein TonB
LNRPFIAIADDDAPGARGATRRHLGALGASVAAHAALLAAVIWLLPSPLPRPSQWVLAYFIELGAAGAPGGRAGVATAAAAATPVARAAPPRQRGAKRVDAPAPDVRLLVPSASPAARGAAVEAREAPSMAASAAVEASGARGAGAGASIGGDGSGKSAAGAGTGAGGGDAGGVSIALADYAHSPLPRYPEYARRHEQQGTVTLRVLVGEDGAVLAAKVAESSGYDSLDEAALATIRDRWRFTPARRGGIAVQSWVLVPIRFALEDAGRRR